MRKFLTFISFCVGIVTEFVADMLPTAIFGSLLFAIIERKMFLTKKQALHDIAEWLLIIIIVACIFTASSANDLMDMIGTITFSFSGAQLGFNAFFEKKGSYVIPTCFVTALLCAFGGGSIVRDVLFLHVEPIFDPKSVLVALMAAALSIAYCYTEPPQRCKDSFNILFGFLYSIGLAAFIIGTKEMLMDDSISSYTIHGIGKTFTCCVAMGWVITALLYRFQRWRVRENVIFSFNVLKMQVTLFFAETLTTAENEKVFCIVLLDQITPMLTWEGTVRITLWGWAFISPSPINVMTARRTNPLMLLYLFSVSMAQMPVGSRWLQNKETFRDTLIGEHARQISKRINRKTSNFLLVTT